MCNRIYENIKESVSTHVHCTIPKNVDFHLNRGTHNSMFIQDRHFLTPGAPQLPLRLKHDEFLRYSVRHLRVPDRNLPTPKPIDSD